MHGLMDARVGLLDWSALQDGLDQQGVACARGLLRADECAAIAELYPREQGFRSRVVMARHGFGRSEYRYFSYPLPALVQGLRSSLYPRLVATANRWNQSMGLESRYPEDHAVYLQHLFPLQAAILLSEPGRDFDGGEFVVTEQRPRMQSRVEVLTLHQGDAAIFAVRERPAKGARGTYRVKHRHGVSRLKAGRRHTLGIIFHDAL